MRRDRATRLAVDRHRAALRRRRRHCARCAFLAVTLASAALCGLRRHPHPQRRQRDADGPPRARPAPRAVTEANAGAGMAGIVAPLVVGARRRGRVSAGGPACSSTLLLAGVAAPGVPRRAGAGGRRGRPGGPPGGAAVAAAAVLADLDDRAVRGRRRVLPVAVVRPTSCTRGPGCRSAPRPRASRAVLVGLTVSRLVGGRLAVRRDVDGILRVRPGRAARRASSCSGWRARRGSRSPAWSSPGWAWACSTRCRSRRAIAVAPGRTDLAATRVSLAAGIASGCAPFLLGFAADRVGTHTAFLIVPVLIVAAMALLAVSHPGLPRGARRPAPAPAEWPGAA